MITPTFFALLLPAFVSAHGYIRQVTVDGTVYPGNTVGTTPTIKSVIRQINTNDPVKGASNPNLNCGQGATLAAETATANPGSVVQVQWVGGVSGDTPWFHNTGPVMHYMAQCEGSCPTYNSSNAEWFKIAELGLESDGRTWYQAELAHGPVNVTIPDTLAPGDYLLRSEIIALQGAVSEGGAEFYPSCIQLTVGGSQTGKPSSSEEVTFPGGYKDTDPGILTPNIYTPPINYVFPGPPIAAFVTGGSSTVSGPSGNTTTTSPNTTTTSPSPTAPASSSPYSSPTNVGAYLSSTLSSTAAPTPSPSSTSGSGSCMPKRSEVHVTSKRMHRRRYRTSH